MGKIPGDYLERCYAGWLGKVIGVRLGAPVESWTEAKIQMMLGEPTDYIVNYRDFAADDDTNGPLFFLRALSDYGCSPALTAEQIGLTWLNYAPYEHGFYWWGGYGVSTEHTAYLNLRAGIMAPRSGSIAQNGAAVAEQIGGQIFVDAWGLVAPGNPALAAELAGKAASVSHDGNGIYGGRFVAAAISAAFVEKDIRAVLETALAQIPQDCEYARMARDIEAFHAAEGASGWRACMAHIRQHWGYDRYPGACHIIPNAAVMMMGMLYGEGDFSKSIVICTQAGWDTDCNAGNVGAIVGTLAGLDGIEARWRKPVNDFLAMSSVVGCLNIANLPQQVRDIASLAYRLAGERPPQAWADFVCGKHTFDFALPGSTCAFRVRGDRRDTGDTLAHEDRLFETGRGGLKATLLDLNAQDARYLYHGTYYRPAQFHDNRYLPAFSPILYPGQTVTARVRAEGEATLAASAYVLDSNTGRVYAGDTVPLRAGAWTTVALTIPALCGACLAEAGVRVAVLAGDRAAAAVYVDHMDFSGKADYTLDFACERMEAWAFNQREVSQMTRLKGLWDLENGRLLGTCADTGEAYTGDIAWGDAEVTCTWTPDVSRGQTGFLLRVQGAIRGYAVLTDGQTLQIAKNSNGYTPLASCPAPSFGGGTLTLTARAVGNRIEVRYLGESLLCAADEDNPYLNGMTGLAVRNGGHAYFHSLRVREL